MTRAFERVFGVADAFDGIPIAGFTDSFLLSRALEKAALRDTRDAHETFRAIYLDILRDEIRKPARGRTGLMPGVQPLVEQIARNADVYPALLTGNYESAAQIKLTHFGLGNYFSWGAFGEDSADRKELARLALERAVARSVPASARQNVIVIGDTPHDVACAQAVGARAIAVATGSYSVAQLRESGADEVFEDLRDTTALLRLL